MELIQNLCICKSGNDGLLFPQKMEQASLSAYEFSARRKRGIQHYRIVRCNTCGLVRSDPVLSDRDLTELYRKSQFLYPEESSHAAKTYASLVARYLGMFRRPEQIRLLEIGCGNGSFLEEMQRRRLRAVTGVEPSVHAIENASETLKPAIINDVFRPGLFPSETFDVVCAFHLLDHLIDPVALIKESFRILDKKGIIILVCHHVDALVNKFLGEYSPIFDVEHIFLFNPATLRNFTASQGYIPIGEGRVMNTYRLSYWFRYMPIINRFVEKLPLWINNIPFTFYAGNIYICAQKR